MNNLQTTISDALKFGNINYLNELFEEGGDLPLSENEYAFITTDEENNHTTVGYGETSYVLSNGRYSATIISRTDGTETLSAKGLAELFPGVNIHNLLIDEENGMTTKQKLKHLKTGFIPLLWCLPHFHTSEYFSRVIHSQYSPFGGIFMDEYRTYISQQNLPMKNMDKVFINLEDAPSIVPEIDKWLDNGAETFFIEH
jgi:hypothetical protein